MQHIVITTIFTLTPNQKNNKYIWINHTGAFWSVCSWKSTLHLTCDGKIQWHHTTKQTQKNTHTHTHSAHNDCIGVKHLRLIITRSWALQTLWTLAERQVSGLLPYERFSIQWLRLWIDNRFCCWHEKWASGCPIWWIQLASHVL